MGVIWCLVVHHYYWHSIWLTVFQVCHDILLAFRKRDRIWRWCRFIYNVKIDLRIQALRDLSDIRVRSMEDELIGATGKDKERLRKAIAREKRKVADKIAILEEKMKYVGTYSLDAVCLIDVV